MAPLDPRSQFRRRIDILKRLGSEVRGSTLDVDEDKYRVLANGMIVKRETYKQGLWVNGVWVGGDE